MKMSQKQMWREKNFFYSTKFGHSHDLTRFPLNHEIKIKEAKKYI